MDIQGTNAASGQRDDSIPGGPPAPFRPARTYLHHGITVVELHGAIGLSTVPEVRAHSDAATARQGARVTVDLRPVEFLDCATLGLLCRARRRALDEAATWHWSVSIPGTCGSSKPPASASSSPPSPQSRTPFGPPQEDPANSGFPVSRIHSRSAGSTTTLCTDWKCPARSEASSRFTSALGYATGFPCRRSATVNGTSSSQRGKLTKLRPWRETVTPVDVEPQKRATTAH
ncbi:STAS domain-containing protein [Streptomyces sp. NPDC006265]|uniref:STAS domain-containing protein n=1 Tax=Streptomyces sp. NPDC006265 TaxID=3156740 RepID=UPI0033A1DFAD